MRLMVVVPAAPCLFGLLEPKPHFGKLDVRVAKRDVRTLVMMSRRKLPEEVDRGHDDGVVCVTVACPCSGVGGCAIGDGDHVPGSVKLRLLQVKRDLLEATVEAKRGP